MQKCVVNVWAISNWLLLYLTFGTLKVSHPVWASSLMYLHVPWNAYYTFASYIVVDPAGTPLAKRQLLSEQEYREYEAQFNEDGYTIGGKSVVIETVAQRNERLAIVREAQRKERYNAALRDDATIQS